MDEKNEKTSLEKREDVISETASHSSQPHPMRVAARISAQSERMRENANAILANPLAGISRDQLLYDGEAFAKEHGLGHLVDEFRKGAVVAQDPLAFESLDILSEDEKEVLRREQTHKWSQPFQLYWLVVMCSVAAAVQGVSIKSFKRSTFSQGLTFFTRWMKLLSTVPNCSLLRNSVSIQTPEQTQEETSGFLGLSIPLHMLVYLIS